MSQLFKKIVRYLGIWGITPFLDFTFPCKNAFDLAHGALISMILIIRFTFSYCISLQIYLFPPLLSSILHLTMLILNHIDNITINYKSNTYIMKKSTIEILIFVTLTVSFLIFSAICTYYAWSTGATLPMW